MRSEVRGVYRDALRTELAVAVAFAGFAALLALFKNELETEFGLKGSTAAEPSSFEDNHVGETSDGKF